MARALLAAALVVAASGIATAAPTRKVAVDTDPPGATVYIGDKESGAVCTTPCSVDLPLGTSIVIVELAAYVSDAQQIDVPRPKHGDKKLAMHFALTKAIGTLVVDGSGPAKGATIKIDNEDKGKAPASLDIEAGPHHVQVIAGKQTLFDDFVNIDPGGETPIAPKPSADAGSAAGDDDAPPHHEREVPDDDSTPPPAASKPTALPLLEVAAVVDFGFRHFHYNGTSVELANYAQTGQVALGLEGELRPFGKLGVDALAPLSLYGKFTLYSVPQRLENADADMLETFWHTLELSARYRYAVVPKLALEGSVGYQLDQYEFSGSYKGAPQVPDAEYSGVRFGLRVIATLGAIEPYLALEDRVMKAQLIDYDFDTTHTNGKRGAIGATVRFGHFYGRAEGSYLAYDWSLAMAGITPTAVTDHIEQLTFAVGGSY